MDAAFVLAAAQAAAVQAAAAPERPRPIRWEEDWRPRPGAAPPPLKHLPLGDGASVAFGLEARWRGEAYDEPLFGRLGARDFQASTGRLLVHADLRAKGSGPRLFVQLGASDERGWKPVARPFDESAVDLAQAFVELPVGELRLRLGRQELPFGRFVSLRDGTNLRRTFDGARAQGRALGLDWDAFAARPTRNGPDAFDDAPDQGESAWGVAASRDVGPLGRATATVFVRRDERARYAAGSGEETRYSYAGRLSGTRGPWRWDAQGAVQTGTLETPGRTLDIRAYGFASEVSRALEGPWRPRFAIRLDAAGGDDDPADGRLGTFDLGFPNLSYLSDAAAIAPRNVIDVHPFVTVAPARSLELTGGVELLWRLKRGDAVYAPPALPVAPTGTGGSPYAGAQLYGRAVWRPTPNWELMSSVVRIEPGPAITRAGGRAQSFALIQTTYRY